MDTPEKPPRTAKLLTVDLGADLKAAWSTWCKTNGQTPSQAIRALIESRLADPSEPPQKKRKPTRPARLATKPDSGPKVGHEVYFTPTEHAALLAVAAAQGFGLHEFVIAAVRAGLAQAPTYGQAELEALTQSNARLVNVLAALVALRAETAVGGIAGRLEALEKDLKAHIESVSKTLATGTRRWQLKI